MIFREALGEVLRELRKEQGLPMRTVSEKSYVSLGYLSELETGKKEASSGVVQELARALGLEPADLIIKTGMRMAGWRIPDTIAELLSEQELQRQR